MGVGDKFLDGDPRVFMVGDFIEVLRRHGNDVRAGQRRADNIARGTDAADNQLALEIPVVQPGHGVGDNFGRVAAFVIDPAGKKADIGGAGLGGEHQLSERQYGRGIDLDAGFLKLADNPQTGRPEFIFHRYFNDDIVC